MSDERHWLYRPQNIPTLWKWGLAILALSIVAEFFVHMHAGFGFADWFAFNSLFGFSSCLLMVVFAKWLGGWVKRPEDYYGPVPGPGDGFGAPMAPASTADDAPDGDKHERDPS